MCETGPPSETSSATSSAPVPEFTAVTYIGLSSGQGACGLLAKKRAKTLLKSRDDDAMVIDDESAPAAPLTGRQKHAQKVAAKRALRAAKQDIQQQRWAIPKRSVDRKAERKQLVEQAKALRREGTADATDAPAPPDDAPMAEKPAFAYAVDAKKARKAAKRRAKERAREARYDGDVQKTP